MADAKNVLVIGNGFDIAHGLPTTYKDFLDYVESNKRIYEKVTKLKEIFDVKIVDVNLNSSMEELYQIILNFKESLKSQLFISPEIYNYINDIKNITIKEQLEFLEKEFSVTKEQVPLFTNNLDVLSLVELQDSLKISLLPSTEKVNN